MDEIKYGEWISLDESPRDYGFDDSDCFIVAWIPYKDNKPQTIGYKHFYAILDWYEDDGFDITELTQIRCWKDYEIRIVAWMPLPEQCEV